MAHTNQRVFQAKRDAPAMAFELCSTHPSGLKRKNSSKAIGYFCTRTKQWLASYSDGDARLYYPTTEIVYFLTTGYWPCTTDYIVHADGNVHNNQFSNLTTVPAAHRTEQLLVSSALYSGDAIEGYADVVAGSVKAELYKHGQLILSQEVRNVGSARFLTARTIKEMVSAHKD